MSCNCEDISKSELWTSIPRSGLTEMLPGENVECYAARAPEDENKAGGEELPDKITTNAIVPNSEMVVDTKFELTNGTAQKPIKWEMLDPDTDTPITISGLRFLPDHGILNGQMDPQSSGRIYTVKIRATDATGAEVDSRSYTFSPKKFDAGSDLVFKHPLPGSTMTSSFGPRKPPTSGASGMHKGCDFAYPGRVTKDVLASCDGKVIKAGTGSGYGNVVYIHHYNGSGKMMAETRYAHLDRIYVSTGQHVSAGQPIGREGNTGVGTGPHLHFEIRLAGDFPVDPASYLNGDVQIAQGSTAPDDPTASSKVTTKSNTNTVVTVAKVDSTAAGCSKPFSELPSAIDPLPTKADVQEISDSRTENAPEDTPTKDEVKAKIQEILDRHPELDASDKNFIMKTAAIESSYDPYAKNPSSSATGLFQMLDSTAASYYKQMGIEPTTENRTNIEYATEAMVRFYKQEILHYWNEFSSSGGTTIAGKTIKSTAHSATYSSLTKEQFCYGLIHHDGVGNAVNGIDKQGVQIAKSRGFA